MYSEMSIQHHMELAMKEKRYKSLPFLSTDEAKLKEWIELVKNTRPLYPIHIRHHAQIVDPKSTDNQCADEVLIYILGTDIRDAILDTIYIELQPIHTFFLDNLCDNALVVNDQERIASIPEAEKILQESQKS